MLDLYKGFCDLANLAQNRVRLIHEVDLYRDIYGTANRNL